MAEPVAISPEFEAVLHTPRRYADGSGWADILRDDILRACRRSGVAEFGSGWTLE
jgi:hypothetical protein